MVLEWRSEGAKRWCFGPEPKAESAFGLGGQKADSTFDDFSKMVYQLFKLNRLRRWPQELVFHALFLALINCKCILNYTLFSND